MFKKSKKRIIKAINETIKEQKSYLRRKILNKHASIVTCHLYENQRSLCLEEASKSFNKFEFLISPFLFIRKYNTGACHEFFSDALYRLVKKKVCVCGCVIISDKNVHQRTHIMLLINGFDDKHYPSTNEIYDIAYGKVDGKYLLFDPYEGKILNITNKKRLLEQIYSGDFGETESVKNIKFEDVALSVSADYFQRLHVDILNKKIEASLKKLSDNHTKNHGLINSLQPYNLLQILYQHDIDCSKMPKAITNSIVNKNYNKALRNICNRGMCNIAQVLLENAKELSITINVEEINSQGKSAFDYAFIYGKKN